MLLTMLPLLLRSFGPVDAWDLGILQWIQENMVNPFFDAVMPALSFLADKGWFWIAVSVVLMIIPKTRKIGFTMALALTFGLIFGNGIIKNLVARTRPYDLYPEMYGWLHGQQTDGGPLRLLVHAESDLSFPSGHTLASLEGAFALFLRSRKWGVAALVLALSIAFSRLYVCVHYPTDVFAAILLGCLFAFLAKVIVDKLYDLAEKRRTDKALKAAASEAEEAAVKTEE